MSDRADPDVVVLRRGTHGLPMAEYVDALRERLPEYDIAHARTPQEERELVEQARVVTGCSIDEDLLARAENLEVFACAYAGYGHLPMDVLRERDVAVTNAAGIHAPSIAEQVLGYLLTFARRLHEGWRRQQHREYRHYQAHELGGSTVTVVGLGAIGHAVVERLQGFDVDTIGVRYTPEKGAPRTRSSASTTRRSTTRSREPTTSCWRRHSPRLRVDWSRGPPSTRSRPRVCS